MHAFQTRQHIQSHSEFVNLTTFCTIRENFDCIFHIISFTARIPCLEFWDLVKEQVSSKEQECLVFRSKFAKLILLFPMVS